jgi:hypothetical protein
LQNDPGERRLPAAKTYKLSLPLKMNRYREPRAGTCVAGFRPENPEVMILARRGVDSASAYIAWKAEI